MPAIQRCPSCFLEVEASAFQCPRCELLLTETLVESRGADARPKSLVRWLVAEPQAEREPRPPTPPPLPADGQKTTRPMRLPPSLELVPQVIAALRLTELNLTPFEAWVISLVDGRTNGRLLAAALDLSELETAIVLQTLSDKRVVKLEHAAPPATAKRVEAEPPMDAAAGNALQIALQMERAGQIAQAARFLEIAVATSPDAAPLYNRLALVVIRESGDLPQAQRLLEQALKLAPGNPIYERNLATVRSQRR